jgi:hypothetical protein
MFFTLANFQLKLLKMPTERNPDLLKAIRFVESIGIAVVEKELPETTFLPGITLGPNTIFIDYSKLKYPGDILHEAGHLAVTAPEDRLLIGSDNMRASWPEMGDEITATLWSYAALTHLGFAPEFVFHKEGYRGGSQWFIDNFTKGKYMGLPLLQWFKMAHSDDDVLNGKPAFPVMQNWMRPDGIANIG